jgi:hypothetical protein
MIKFFRKIRQKMLTENKFSKYLLYAIGEIVLVVIGILIALQINNWNEHRKTNLKEQSLYKKIIVDLEQEEKILTEALTIYKEYSNSYDHIYNETIGKASYDSTRLIYSHLRWHVIYELIVINKHESAISEINNDKIIELLNQKTWIEVINSQAKSQYNNYKDEIVPAFFSRYGIYDSNIIFNLEKNKWDPILSTPLINYDRLKLQYRTIEFEQILVDLRIKTSWAIYNLEKVMEKNKDISIALKKELEK